MPDCHVTSLHENDAGYAPLLQKYEDKGLETLIIDMDFYVEEDAEPGVFTPGTSYEGYSWMFTRESKRRHMDFRRKRISSMKKP